MSEHLSDEQIKFYLNQAMKPVELLEADDHLAACDLCLAKIAESQRAPKVLDFLQFSPEESEHLSYEQLENYVDEKSDDIGREIADVHLQVCADCTTELKGLFEMRSLIADDLQKQALTQDEKSIVAQIRNFFAGQHFLRFGFAALVLLISLGGIFWLLRRDTSTEIAVTSPNANLPQNRENLPENVQPNVNSNVPKNNNSETNNKANLPNQTPTPNETETLPPQYQAEVERVLAANRLNFPNDLKELNNQTGKLMSGGTETIPFALSNPVGKIIQSNRPQFRWNALVGASGYIINIYDTNFNPVAASRQISGTNWQIDRPLSRNKIYTWQVTAIKDGQEIKSPVRPAPDARFKILDAKIFSELSEIKRKYKNSHLALGILYTKAGLLAEAEREFQQEIKKNPNSKQARKFLQEVRKLKQ